MTTPSQIILVQDDPLLAATRKAILEREGYSVDVVPSIRAAKSRSAELSCELMIVDSSKNRKAAVELCEHVKKHNPQVNVAVMTPYHVALDSDCPDEVISQDAGPEGFVKKVNALLGRAN